MLHAVHDEVEADEVKRFESSSGKCELSHGFVYIFQGAEIVSKSQRDASWLSMH